MSKSRGLHLSDGYWLRRLSDAIQGALADGLEAAGFTNAEWYVLSALQGKGLHLPAELATHIGIDRAAVTRTVDKLVRRGLVTRAIGEDRRTTPLCLTPQARKIVPELARIAADNDKAFFRALSLKDRQHLQNTIRTLLIRANLQSRDKSKAKE